MRIVWKDSTVARSNATYRGYVIKSYSTGWVTDAPGDNNIYKTKRCAKNAIDEAFGYSGMRNEKLPKRLEYGYEIIGRKDDKRIG